ncbi:MAG TPA: signal peptidase I [Sphingomonadaceae bacterium]
MNETTETTTATAPEPANPTRQVREKKEEGSFLVFLLKLAVVVLVFRTVIFAPFNIPSESMLPRLLDGDYLLAAKWKYGISNYSLPFGMHPFPQGRIFARQPQRGDIVIFKAPPNDDEDYIKRVIGLPGDQIQMRDGVLFINGSPVKKVRLGDFEVPLSPNTPRCWSSEFAAVRNDGTRICRYPQYRETLPNGVSYNVLDFGPSRADNPWGVNADNTPVYLVPEKMMFLMGDNRDDSLDSRFPAVPNGGISMVPQDNLVGKATIMMWSTDGSSSWLKPWTWFTAARWNRIGRTF